MMGARIKDPCEDCAGGYCTMNCSPVETIPFRTRETHCFKCPSCGNENEPDPEEWAEGCFETDCGSCGAELFVSVSHTVTFETDLLENKDKP